MSHQHYCYVAGHTWECQGKAPRGADTEPTVCICRPCGRPLEGFDHSGCDDPLELLPCPVHRGVDQAISRSLDAKHDREPFVEGDEGAKWVYAFCLWCGRIFHCWTEVEAHKRNNLKACPVHQGLTQRPGGYPHIPPLLRDILGPTRLIEDLESGEGYGPN